MTDNKKKTSKDIFGNIIEKDSNETDKIKQGSTEENKKQTKYGCLLFSVLILFLAFWYLAFYFKEIKGLTGADGYMGIFLGPPFILSMLSIFVFGFPISKYIFGIYKKKLLFRYYFLFWIILLFGDHVLGYLTFKTLCFTKAGSHTYKIIDLPEMPVWKENYNFMEYNTKFDLKYKSLSSYADLETRKFGIAKDWMQLLKDNEVISEWRAYSFYGGWFIHALQLGIGKKIERCNGRGKITDALTINGTPYSKLKNYTIFESSRCILYDNILYNQKLNS